MLPHVAMPGDHDLGGFHDGNGVDTRPEPQPIRRPPRDHGDHVLCLDRERHLDHQTVRRDGADASAKLIPRADIDAVAASRRAGGIATPMEQPLALEEPPPAMSDSGQPPLARQELHALDMQMEQGRRLAGRQERATDRASVPCHRG